MGSQIGPTSRCWDIGTGIAGYVWEARAQRAALLLQHGYGEYAHRYVDGYGGLIRALLERGISVYALDLRGHGDSPGRRGFTTVERAVEDHLAARRRLATLPVPLFLLGHSLGGIVTASSVLRDPAGVHGVILSSPALQVTANPVARIAVRALAAVAPWLPVHRLPVQGISRIAAEVQRATGDPRMHRGWMPAGLAVGILLATHANWERYGEWTLPTLVVHGTADTFTEPDGSRRFIEEISSPDRTLHLVEGGYHELLNDSGREEILRLLVRWLDSRIEATTDAVPD
jgi:acylglycerol lipase